jgi:hypothetical protein
MSLTIPFLLFLPAIEVPIKEEHLACGFFARKPIYFFPSITNSLVAKGAACLHGKLPSTIHVRQISCALFFEEMLEKFRCSFSRIRHPSRTILVNKGSPISHIFVHISLAKFK